MSGVLPLARELGEKLGGDPFVQPIERPDPIAPPMRVNLSLWPAEVREQMQRILNGEEDEGGIL